MRYSDLAGKEIIAVDEGIRLGVVDHTDLVINTALEKWIRSSSPMAGGWGNKVVVIPWRGITRSGGTLSSWIPAPPRTMVIP